MSDVQLEVPHYHWISPVGLGSTSTRGHANVRLGERAGAPPNEFVVPCVFHACLFGGTHVDQPTKPPVCPFSTLVRLPSHSGVHTDDFTRNVGLRGNQFFVDSASTAASVGNGH